MLPLMTLGHKTDYLKKLVKVCGFEKA